MCVAGTHPSAESGSVLLVFNFAPDRLGFGPPHLQVGFDLGFVFKVIGNRTVYLRESQRWKGLDDLFRGFTFQFYQAKM